MPTAPLAGLFEVGGKLRAAVDLHCANGKRHALLPGVEELRRGLRGGTSVGLYDIPARDHVARGELLEDHARYRTHFRCIDLDQAAGLKRRVLLGFAHGIRTGPPTSRFGLLSFRMIGTLAAILERGILFAAKKVEVEVPRQSM